jgi:hypothetical protein
VTPLSVPRRFYNQPIETLPTSYTHQIITGTWRWDPNKKFSWEMEYNWDIWNRKIRMLRAPTTQYQAD